MWRIAKAGVVLLAFTLDLSAASAEEEEYGDWPGKWYVEARGGLSVPPDVATRDIRVDGEILLKTVGLGAIQYDTGYTVGLAGGYQIVDHFRTELELSWRSSNLGKLELQDHKNQHLDGSVGLLAGLVNGYFDMRETPDQVVVPFALVGVGGGYLRVEDASFLPSDGSYNKGVFVWDAGFGLMWAMYRHAAVSFTYRYIGTTDITFESSGSDPSEVTMPYGAHEFFMGIRYTF